jgi:hypothetical protein
MTPKCKSRLGNDINLLPLKLNIKGEFYPNVNLLKAKIKV